MGVVQNVGFDRFPVQGRYIGQRVSVCFDGDTSKRIEGLVVRDDHEEPWVTIFALGDGRYVLATECQWQPL